MLLAQDSGPASAQASLPQSCNSRAELMPLTGHSQQSQGPGREADTQKPVVQPSLLSDSWVSLCPLANAT